MSKHVIPRHLLRITANSSTVFYKKKCLGMSLTTSTASNGMSPWLQLMPLHRVSATLRITLHQRPSTHCTWQLTCQHFLRGVKVWANILCRHEDHVSRLTTIIYTEKWNILKREHAFPASPFKIKQAGDHSSHRKSAQMNANIIHLETGETTNGTKDTWQVMYFQ